MQDIGKRLGEIRVEIPHKLAKPPPVIPHIDDDLEFPEKNLEVTILALFLRKRLPSTIQ